MINGAEKWKTLFQTEELLPESSVRMYADIGRTAIDGIVFSNGEAKGSEANNTIGKPIDDGIVEEAPLYATLEHNYWLLDGTFDYVDNVDSDYQSNRRYVSSQISNQNGDFIEKPSLSYDLANSRFGSNAVTIQFGDKTKEYATEINIEKVGYGHSENLQGKQGYNVFSIVKTDGDTYNQIDIEILSWSMPYRRARFIQVWDGVRLCFEKDKFSKFKISKSADVLSGALPQNTFTAEIFDLENEFDVDVGIYRDVLNESRWRVEGAYKIDNNFNWINFGYYYLQNFSRPKNGLTAKFNFSDISYKIAGKFPAEIQGSPSNPITDPYIWNTWRELFAKISSATNVSIIVNGGYDLDDKAAGYPTQRTFRTQLELPVWLQTVANASKAIIKSKGNDTIEINTLINSNYTFKDKNAIDRLLLFNAYDYPEIERLGQIRDCTFTGYKPPDDTVQYSFNKIFDTVGVSQTATNERVRFDDKNVSTDYTFPSTYADSYNQWVYMFISNARRLNGTSRINPGLEIFDLLEVETKSGQIVKGYLTSIEIEFNGAFKGKYSVYAPIGQN